MSHSERPVDAAKRPCRGGARVSGQRVGGMKRLSGAHGNREQKPSLLPHGRREGFCEET